MWFCWGDQMTTTKFISKMIVRTERSADGRTIEVTLGDGRGELNTFTLNAESAACLAKVLKDFDGRTPGCGLTPTKFPRRFAVGHGRNDRVVLVRFEDDTPYGLDAEQAAELGSALVEEAEDLSLMPAPMRQ